MTILDGKKTSDNIKDEIAIAVQKRKEAGLKIGYCPLVEVDFLDIENPYFKRNQEENRVLFVRKHKEWLIKNLVV